MFIQHIGATGLQNLTDGDESFISCVEFTVYGFTGSMIPQCVQMTDGPMPTGIAAPNYFNAGYVNANTGVSYAAGTAITTDGRYIIDTTGAKCALNVTDAGDGDFYVYGKPLAGPAPTFAASGGTVTLAGTEADNTANSTTKLPVLAARANAAAPTWTETFDVPLSTDLSGNLRVTGTSTLAGTAADNSTNSTTKLPVLAAVATAAAQAWTEGRQVPASVDLFGNARVKAGLTTVIKPIFTVSTTPAYTANDDIGGLGTIASAVAFAAGTAVFQSLELIFKSGTTPTGVFLVFDANPTAATITDNAAFVWSTDQAKCIGMITIASGDLVTVGGQTVAKPQFVPFPVKAASGTTLYCAYIGTGTPTFTATTDMLCAIGLLQDLG